MCRCHSFLRKAFSLVESLVVIAIIATLIAILLPAVHKVREAGLRIRCQNNLRQLSTGLIHVNDSLGQFPGEQTMVSRNPLVIHSWVLDILPYIEQTSLFSQYRQDKNFDDPLNQPVVKKTIATVICPSAANDRIVFAPHVPYGIRDYGPFNRVSRILASSGLLDPWQPTSLDMRRGPMEAAASSRRIIDILDGTSHTLLLVESAGSPSLWQAGKMDDLGGSVVQRWAGNDTMDLDGSSHNGTRTPGQCAINCTNDGEVYSMHPSAANVVFCDGHVVSVRNTISIKTLAALVTRSGGERMTENDY